jgi:hypothetical protein
LYSNCAHHAPETGASFPQMLKADLEDYLDLFNVLAAKRERILNGYEKGLAVPPSHMLNLPIPPMEPLVIPVYDSGDSAVRRQNSQALYSFRIAVAAIKSDDLSWTDDHSELVRRLEVERLADTRAAHDELSSYVWSAWRARREVMQRAGDWEHYPSLLVDYMRCQFGFARIRVFAFALSHGYQVAFPRNTVLGLLSYAHAIAQ